LWQVPFAYLGITGLAFSGATNPAYRWLVFLGSFALGLAVLFQMNGLKDGVRRAVRNILHVEEQLHLDLTAQERLREYMGPLELVVGLVTLASLGGFIWLWL